MKSIATEKFSNAAKVIFRLTSAAGLGLSVISVLDICTSACYEASAYTIFGLRLGWFGIMFFSALLATLILHSRYRRAGLFFTILVYGALGAEIRLIWLQKFVIGVWCPLCLAIAFAVFLAFGALLLENWKSIRSEKGQMKTFLRYTALLALTLALGLSLTIIGVNEKARAAELNLFLGKTDSPTVVYFVSDWFCPACRRTEPAVEKMFPRISAIAKVAFVDVPVHPETSNFTPYNLQFLIYDKAKYLQLRGALGNLAKKNSAPSPEDVQAAIASTGVKLRNMNYADILKGLKWNENVFKTFKIHATPTVVVSNAETGKHVNLVGENEISYGAIIRAIAEVGK